MSLPIPFSAPPLTQLLTTAIVTLNQKAPFLVDSPCRLWSPSAQTVYGAKHPGVRDTSKYWKYQPATTINANTSIAVPSTISMHDVAAAGLTDANRMRVIVVKNGTTVLTRMGNDATAATGQFNEIDATHIKLGDALTASDTIELFALAAGDIVTLTGGATTAGRVYDVTCYSFMTATGVANLVGVMF